MRETPPILSGNIQNDLTRMRDYLIRTAGEIDDALEELRQQNRLTARATGQSADVVTQVQFQDAISKKIGPNDLPKYYSKIEEQVKTTCREIIGGNT